MANEGNLKPIRTTEEARERGSKGGKASGESKREKKRLRECLEAILDGEIEIDGNKVTVTEAMAVAAVKAALRGDWKAWELVRDTSGQKPIEKVVTSEVDPDVIAEVESYVCGGEPGDDEHDEDAGA